jgi:lipid-binding SYLF domain-containing protein
LGVDLNGTAITPDNKLNEAFYGMKARDLLNGMVANTPARVSIFPETLGRY